ncbi:hypothetical protein NKI12_24850 [Mesorhizobium australicum]
MSCKSIKLDVQALIDRLGAGHGSMRQDLAGCSAARIARLRARERRKVFFTCIPDYDGQNRERNRDWKPTFDRSAAERK